MPVLDRPVLSTSGADVDREQDSSIALDWERVKRNQLVGNLSGGDRWYHQPQESVRPATMRRRVTLDESYDESELTPVRLFPVNEADDHW